MGFSRTDCSNNAFTNTGNDGLFTSTTDKAFDIGTHSDTGLGAQLNAVFGDSSYDRGFNDFGGNRHLDSLENIASGQVDGADLLECERNIGTLSSDQGVDDAVHITTGEEVCFQLGNVEIQTGLVGFDQRIHQTGRSNMTDAHTDQGRDRYMHTAGHGANPHAERDIVEQNNQENQDNKDDQTQCKQCFRHSTNLLKLYGTFFWFKQV